MITRDDNMIMYYGYITCNSFFDNSEYRRVLVKRGGWLIVGNLSTY